MAKLLQFAIFGLAVGTVYAPVALGFTLIYNASMFSEVINFAPGEFVMVGGIAPAFVARPADAGDRSSADGV